MLRIDMIRLTAYQKKFLACWLKNMLQAGKVFFGLTLVGGTFAASLMLVNYLFGIWGLIIYMFSLSLGIISYILTDKQLLDEKLKNDRLLHEIKYSELNK